MSNWTASNYRANKAKRQANVKPEWVTNPATGEKFLLRRVGAIASVIAGYMPHDLTNKAIAGWKEEGVEIAVGDTTVTLSPKQLKESERELQLMAKVVQQACVIPKLVPGATEEDELDPAELEESDILFIFKYAMGQVNSAGVPMVGGQAMPLGSLETFRKKPGRRARTGTGG